jgi:hypothetical protein
MFAVILYLVKYCELGMLVEGQQGSFYMKFKQLIWWHQRQK